MRPKSANMRSSLQQRHEFSQSLKDVALKIQQSGGQIISEVEPLPDLNAKAQLPSKFERRGQVNKSLNLDRGEISKIQVILELKAKQIANLKADIQTKAVEKKEVQKQIEKQKMLLKSTYMVTKETR